MILSIKMNPVLYQLLITFLYLACTVNAKPFIHYGRCKSNLSDQAVCLPLDDCDYYKHLTNYKQTEKCDGSNARSLICCPKTSQLNKIKDETRDSSTTVPFVVGSRTGSSGVLPQPPYCGLILSDRVYGGNETNLDEHPWMARLESGFHGGTLIHERWVLTAAHCIIGRALRPGWTVVSARFGEWNVDSNPDCIHNELLGTEDCAPVVIDIPIDLQVPHPEFDSYKPNVPNDIALLRLQHPVRPSQFVKPVCLPFVPVMQAQSFAGSTGEVCGWGRTQDNDRPSKLKLKALLEVQSFEDCASEYRKYSIELDERQMCAGGVIGIDACRGDSGGPLILELSKNKQVANYQIGVVSLGKIRCGSSSTPGLYTRVAPYIDWISETITKN